MTSKSNNTAGTKENDDDDDEKRLHSEDYWSWFPVNNYLTKRYAKIDDNRAQTPFTAFFIRETVRILNEKASRFVGKKNHGSLALDFGAGPVLWPSFLLAQYIDSIRVSDYTPNCLQAIKDWLNTAPMAHDWTAIFEYVFNEYQKQKNHQASAVTMAEWETRLRDALNRGDLISCDVNASDCPVLSGEPDQYDIIFTSLCLESACLTDELYKKTIKRLFKILKPGGMLLMLVMRNTTWYMVTNRRFHRLPLNELKVTQNLEEANFVNIHIVSEVATPEHRSANPSSNFDGLMVVHAFKPQRNHQED